MAITDIKPANQRTLPGPQCAVCVLESTLTGPEQQAFIGLLSDRTVRYTWLSEQLEGEGVVIAAFMLSYHARGKCGSRKKLR